jgi:hypothetical protein
VNPGDRSNTEGESVSLEVEASDPDGDALKFTAIGLPLGLSIDENSGEIKWDHQPPGLHGLRRIL